MFKQNLNLLHKLDSIFRFSNQLIMSSKAKLISETFVRPQPDVHESKRIHHLNPFDISRLLADNAQPGYLYATPSNFEPNSYLNRLRLSLCRALVYFCPLAGRLISVQNQSQHSSYVYVDCAKGPGARFIHASAPDLTMARILSPCSSDEFKGVWSLFDLGEVSNNYDGHTRALLTVQLTELRDGVFIGICYNHSVVDGVSIFHFQRVWSHIFMGTFSLSIRLPIVKQPDFLTGRVVNLPYVDPDEFIIRYESEGELMGRVFQFSVESLKIIKALGNSDVIIKDGVRVRPVSTFQSLIAFVWKCITRVRDLNPGDPTTCGLPVNLRPRFDPPLADQYFGNYAVKAKATATAGDLVSNNVGWAAMLIQQAIAAQDDKSARGVIDRVMETGPEFVPPTRTCRSNDVIVASSPRFDVEESRFGLGRLMGFRGGSANKWDGKVYAYLGSLGHGSVDLDIRLVPDTMNALLVDREFMSFVSMNDARSDLVSRI